jgi:hypothetical protein
MEISGNGLADGGSSRSTASMLESDDVTLKIVSVSGGKSVSLSVFCSVHADKPIVQVYATSEQWRCGKVTNRNLISKAQEVMVYRRAFSSYIDNRYKCCR